MIISTKGRYALRVMLDLVLHPTDGYIPLQEISDRQGISKEYLSAILKTLVENGQLTSLRGKGGGYRLSMAPEAYTVGPILRLVEGDLAPVACVAENSPCANHDHCRSYPMWRKLNTMINDYFDQIHLTDLIDTAGEPE